MASCYHLRHEWCGRKRLYPDSVRIDRGEAGAVGAEIVGGYGMVRRIVFGALAVAAVAGSAGWAAPAQAQVSDCRSWYSLACGEAYFNMNPDPLDVALAQAAASAARAQSQPVTQAAAQSQPQPDADE